MFFICCTSHMMAVILKWIYLFNFFQSTLSSCQGVLSLIFFYKSPSALLLDKTFHVNTYDNYISITYRRVNQCIIIVSSPLLCLLRWTKNKSMKMITTIWNILYDTIKLLRFI